MRFRRKEGESLCKCCPSFIAESKQYFMTLNNNLRIVTAHALNAQSLGSKHALIFLTVVIGVPELKTNWSVCLVFNANYLITSVSTYQNNCIKCL